MKTAANLTVIELKDSFRDVWDGGYLANFPRSVIFRICQHCQNKRWLSNITFIFD